jgi:hypothetical protein
VPASHAMSGSVPASCMSSTTVTGSSAAAQAAAHAQSAIEGAGAFGAHPPSTGRMDAGSSDAATGRRAAEADRASDMSLIPRSTLPAPTPADLARAGEVGGSR